MQPKTYFMKNELIHELFEKFEQACYFYIIRKQCFRTAGQPDCLTRQIESLQVCSDAAGVTLVKNQVEYMEYCRQPFSTLPRER